MKAYYPLAKAYEDDILTGRKVAGKLLKLAIKRHRNDLKTGHQRGIFFDHEEGMRWIDFFGILNLGPDQPFQLLPFQAWEIYVFYGWRRTDGTRRFRTLYKSCARKNGKTPLASGQILGHLTIDGQYRSEAYVSATKEDQAKICFDDAKSMLSHTPELTELLSSTATTVFNPENSSKFQFLTSNPKTADGTRPSFALIDEYHEFDSDAMLTKLRTGQIHYKEPIFQIVTTRGSHKDWPCFEAERRVYIPILQGSVTDDSTFVVIYSQDSEDEFEKPETWGKSNPMLDGGILTLQSLVEARDRAVMMGEEAIVGFKTLNLNWWCDAPQTFIPESVWVKSGSRFAEEDLRGRECWTALDMAQTNDFCAFAMIFPPDDWQQSDCEIEDEKAVYVRSPIRVPGTFKILWRFWIPEDKKEQRIANGLHALRDWVRDGYVRLLDGNVIDPRQIEEDIKQLRDRFDIRQMVYDRYNATSTALSLAGAGIPVLEFPQTMAQFTTPTKAFRDLVLQKRLDHGFNPVAQWMMRNAVPIMDTKANIMITKDPKRSVDKVDGVVAAIMAMGSWMSDSMETTRSQYEDSNMEWF